MRNLDSSHLVWDKQFLLLNIISNYSYKLEAQKAEWHWI